MNGGSPKPILKVHLEPTKSSSSSSLWEYVLHGVAPLLRVEVGLLDDLQSVGGEHPPEEEVDEEDLPDDVDQVQDLAEDEAQEVDAVRLGAAQPTAVPDEVVAQGLHLGTKSQAQLNSTNLQLN